MKKQTNKKKIHIDNLYLMKKLDTAYLNEFNRFYDYILDSRYTVQDMNLSLIHI